MATERSILALLDSSEGFTDAAMLRVIAPPQAERDRSTLVEQSGIILPGVNEENDWRRTAMRAGTMLDYGTQNVLTNHFSMNNGQMPPKVHQYAVFIFKISRGFGVSDKDLAKEGESKINIALMQKLRTLHPSWRNASAGQSLVGYCYDGKAILFSTHELFDREYEQHQRSEHAFPTPRASDSSTQQIYGPGDAAAAGGGGGGGGGAGEGVEMHEGESVPMESSPPNESGDFDYAQDILLDESDQNSKYHIRIRFVKSIERPESQLALAALDNSYVRALDSALLAFVRGESHADMPEWIIQGNKAFHNVASLTFKTPQPNTQGMRGFHTSLRPCIAGLTLVCDFTVSIFLVGGELINIVASLLNMRVDEFHLKCKDREGLSANDRRKLNKELKGIRMKLKHIGHIKKFKEVCLAADDPNQTFTTDRPGQAPQTMTVKQYFASTVRDSEKSNYHRHLKSDGLQFPYLPCINFGSVKAGGKKILIPMELLIVPGGQGRNENTPDVTAAIIKQAAVVPSERFSLIADKSHDSLMSKIRNDHDAKAFGINGLATEPMKVHASLLPPARIQYDGAIVDPKLAGSWNKPNQARFTMPPPSPRIHDGQPIYLFGSFIIGGNSSDVSKVQPFIEELCSESRRAGITLTSGGPPFVLRSGDAAIRDALGKMKTHGVRIVMVFMRDESCYQSIKSTIDRIGLPSQCIRWNKLERPPRGYHGNVLLKMNAKMGGINHTLATRGSYSKQPGSENLFQHPPQSLSWLFDKPCMLVGIDISVPENGHEDSRSLGAVVGSMDGSCGQYSAYLSLETDRSGISQNLAVAIEYLVNTFKQKNGCVPETILFYRDGVSEGQFAKVVEKEVQLIKDGLALTGNIDKIKIAFVVCTKRHHTRIVYEKSDGQIVNPCSGLVVDATNAQTAIVSSSLNEFILNSHATIQGTARATRYTLLYDEIGLNMPELELLTYWTTYLYCRCNRSVGICAPAYYAALAAKRAHTILADERSKNSEVSNVALEGIFKAMNDEWAEAASPSSMYFV